MLFSNPGSTSYFATADFNHDGIPDLAEMAVNTTAVDQSSPATLRTYLGTPGGSYQLTGTFGPFPNGTLNLYAGGAPENPVWPVQPRLGDFNGDGNVDIAVFSAGEGGSYDASDGIISSSALPTALTILAGNGDGTFTQSNVYFNLGDLLAPQLAGNIEGDPRSDFVEMDSYSSSFDVISAQSGPHIRAGAGVVPGDRRDGSLQVTLTFPSASSTGVQLSSSEPNISIPSTVTLPAGTVSQNVPFQIGTAFNPNHVFALTGQLGSETHTAYGTQTTSAAGTGFVVEMLNPPINPPAVVASGSTTAYQVVIASLGGYSTQIQPSCQGLPSGATCQFGGPLIDLPAGQVLTATITITAEDNLAGHVLTHRDFLRWHSNAAGLNPVQRGRFQPVDHPRVGHRSAHGFGDVRLLHYGNQRLCGIGGDLLQWFARRDDRRVGRKSFRHPHPLSFYIQTQNVAVGTYPFTVTGTVGSVTHTAYRHARGSAATGHYRKRHAHFGHRNRWATRQFRHYSQLPIWSSGTVVFLRCEDFPSGATGAFNPTTASLPANGTISGTLSVQVNSSVAAGSYSMTVMASTGLLVYSSTVTLVVQSAPPAFTGSVSPTTATLSVGQSANFSITLNSQSGATGAVALQCLNVPAGSTCAFSPSSPTLPANGNAADTLTVQVNSMPAAPIFFPRSVPPPKPVLWIVAALAGCLLLSLELRRRRWRAAASLAALLSLLLLFLVSASCGGGGGSPPPSNPPPSPVVMSITVQASGAGVSGTQTLGTVSITVN